MKQLIFENKNKEQLIKFLKTNKKRKILNFLNQHDLYQLNKENLFEKSLEKNENLNFIDGFTISAYLSIRKLKRIPRIRGPTFTKNFLSNKNLSGEKKHFFIGIEKGDLNKLKEKFPHLNKIKSHNPPFIKDLKFSKEEIDKISKLINKFKADYVWVGVGSPKQNILSDKLFESTNSKYFINIGAALDFLLNKKQEAPLITRELGIEWFYRLITDFKYTKKKVIKSFIALKYLRRGIGLENN